MTTCATWWVVIAASVGICACGVPGQTHPEELHRDDVRVVTTTSSTALPQRTRRVDLCLISGEHLVAVVTVLPSPPSVPRVLQALVDLSQSKLPAGRRSLIDAPTLLAGRPATGGVAPVELNAEFTQIPPADQILAIAQVVCTLTSLPGVGQVRFTHGGLPTGVPREDGSLTNQPVSRADYNGLLPARATPGS